MCAGVFHASIAIVEAKLGVTLFSIHQQQILEELERLSPEQLAKEEFGSLRAAGLAFHPIFLAGFLMMTICVATAQFLWRDNQLRLRLFGLVSTPIMLYGLWVTYSRSALISLMVSLAMAIVITSKLGRVAAVIATMIFLLIFCRL